MCPAKVGAERCEELADDSSSRDSTTDCSRAKRKILNSPAKGETPSSSDSSTGRWKRRQTAAEMILRPTKQSEAHIEKEETDVIMEIER